MAWRVSARAPQQRGMAALSALLIVAIVATMAAGILARQTGYVRSVQTEQNRVQARWLLRGGVTWAKTIIQVAAQREYATRPDGIWNQPVLGLAVAAPGDTRFAAFSGEITDEQGKFNLRNLEWGGEVVPGEIDAFRRLCSLLQIPPVTADAIMRRIVLSFSGSDSPPVGNAANLAQYEASLVAAQTLGFATGLPTRAQMNLPRTLNDLLGVEGVNHEFIARLTPHATILPSRTWINANTSSPEVLAARVPGLSPEKARQVIRQRDQGQWIIHQGDFINRLQMPELHRLSLPIASQSSWFLVKGVVEHQGVVSIMTALVYNDRQTSPRTVWLREGA